MQPFMHEAELMLFSGADQWIPSVQAAVLHVCNLSNDHGAGSTMAGAEPKGRGSRARRMRRNRKAFSQVAATNEQELIAAKHWWDCFQTTQFPAQMLSEFKSGGREVKGPEEYDEDKEKMVDESFGDIAEIADSPKQSNEIIARLEDHAEIQRILEMLQGNVLVLALSKHGCRVVQKALEVTDSLTRDRLFAELEPHVVELCDSPHGNHVLAKLVEMMPTVRLKPVIEQLQAQGPANVARHRFGCRVLERLLEHCTEVDIGELIDQIVEKSEMLCRHLYGNFVVQHLLEQGSATRRKCILNQLLPLLPYLAMHRTASHVVQRALAHSDQDDLNLLIDALLCGQSPNSFIDVARSRYGSFVICQLIELRIRSPSYFHVVYETMTKNVEELVQTDFGRRVAENFKLEIPNRNTVCGEMFP